MNNHYRYNEPDQLWDEEHSSWPGGRGLYGGYTSSCYSSDPAKVRRELAPLLEQLAVYDQYRQKLERQGGTLTDIKQITTLLEMPVRINGRGGEFTLQLTNQNGLRSGLSSICYDLHLDIRMLSTGMPVYYLCRAKRDYWGEYSLIVEDLHLSPGYRFSDHRFIRMMNGGHEVYFLRLSQFRATIARMQKPGAATSEQKVDTFLYALGRHIFQAAWHEDQRLAIMVCTHLHLPHFHQAIELLYLCLSGELCELRTAIDGKMRRFFENVYPHPAIRELLGQLPQLDGERLNHLPKDAEKLYKSLLHAFSRFIATEISWGGGQAPLPLWKILYANFSRMELIGKKLLEIPRMKQEATNLEDQARAMTEKLLGKAGSA